MEALLSRLSPDLDLRRALEAAVATRHMRLAASEGRVLGGHVAYGCTVRTIAEVLLMLLPEWSFSRRPRDLRSSSSGPNADCTRGGCLGPGGAQIGLEHWRERAQPYQVCPMRPCCSRSMSLVDYCVVTGAGAASTKPVTA